MKYEDPFIDESKTGNVNVSSEAPLKTFFKLLTVLLSIGIVGYIGLNLAVYQVVQHIPFATEKKYFESIAQGMLQNFADKTRPKQTQELQRIADTLRKNALAKDKNHPLKDITITMHYSDDELVNAFALPAGHIVIMRGLIEKMPNENMLAMVIGHEIGHVVHRDHLKRLGRTALANLFISALLGNSGTTLGQATTLLETGYSREDESRADEAGVHLINTTYGHVFGAAELFDVFATINPSQSRWIEISSTHPLPVNRRQDIQSLVKQHGYASVSNKSTPMPITLQKATLSQLDNQADTP